jgi:hypothetical protein
MFPTTTAIENEQTCCIALSAFDAAALGAAFKAAWQPVGGNRGGPMATWQCKASSQNLYTVTV